jgi:hypothetical protein
MLHHSQRLFAIFMLPLFVLDATGCTHVVKKPVAEVTPKAKDEIVGVTTLAGQQIKFDGAGTIRHDSVHAISGTRWVVVPVDSVRLWWFDRPNPVALAAVLVVGGAVIVMAAGAVFAESLDD